MRSNKEILEEFLSDLDALHSENWGLPFYHTLLNELHLMFHRDWRDFCAHDDCVSAQFQANVATMRAILMPNALSLHKRLYDLMLSALSEMEGKSVGDDAEEFLRNL